MATGTVKHHRVIRTTPDKLYRAFLEPDAVCKWIPPYGFTGNVDHMNPVVGGTYKMSFTNFTTGKNSSFGGKYLELVPGKLIVHTDEFDDPNMPGTMVTRIELKEVLCGTDLIIIQEGIPEIIPVEFCYLGWQESLEQLTKLVEPSIPD